MNGDQSRQVGGPRNTSAPTTAKVARAVTGAAAWDASSRTSVSVSKMIGMTVAAISMITVPEDDGREDASQQREPRRHRELE